MPIARELLRVALPVLDLDVAALEVVGVVVVLDLPVEALADREPDSTRLHVTLNEAEVIGPIPIYRDTTRNTLAVVERLHGLGRSTAVSVEMLHETHVTGIPASFLSYLKACHGR